VAAAGWRIEKLPDSAPPPEPPMLIVIVPWAPAAHENTGLTHQLQYLKFNTSIQLPAKRKICIHGDHLSCDNY